MAKKTPAELRRKRQELVQLANLLKTMDTPNLPEISRLRALRDARSEIDMAIGQTVIRARAENESWSSIGAALGVTPQAVYQRHEERFSQVNQEGGRAELRPLWRSERAAEGGRSAISRLVGLSHTPGPWGPQERGGQTGVRDSCSVLP